MDNRNTEAHWVYQILEFASSGSLPDDLNVTYELGRQWLEEYRSILIGQTLNKKDQVNDSIVQYIPCVDLEQVDAGTCCEEPIGCVVLKSIQRIPSTIDTYIDNWLISVLTPGGISISKSNPIKQRYQKFNKYTKNNRIWWIEDDFLFIKNDVFLDKVSVSLIAEYPSDVARFTCSGKPCFNENSDYPISTTMGSQVINMIIKEKLMPFMQFSADNSNNANSETPKQIIDQKTAGS